MTLQAQLDHAITRAERAESALRTLLSFEDVRYVCDSGPWGEGWKSDELTAALAEGDAIVAATHAKGLS